MSARWRKEPNETGLRSIGQSPRGFELREDGELLIKVSPYCPIRFNIEGWYWYGFDVNTYITKPLFKTKEAAKEDATAFYKAMQQQGKP